MKKIVLYIALLMAPEFGYSQKTENVGIIERNNRGIITSVEFSTTDSKPRSEKEFFKTYLKTSASDQFVKATHRSKRKNQIHDHFDQYYNGIKVEGAGYNFHYENGEMYFANGHYVRINDLDTSPTISNEKATENFTRYKGIEKEKVTSSSVELFIKEIDTLASALLVYRVVLQASDSANNEAGLVHAHTGEVLATESKVRHFTDPGHFYTIYNGERYAGTQLLSDGSYYRLRDYSNGSLVHTKTLLSLYADTANAAEVLDANNTWTQPGLPLGDYMGLDVHWGLQKIRDHLHTTHLIDSYDDAGHPIRAFVRAGNNDFDRDRAWWDSGTKSLYFGEGATLNKKVASLDLVSHEFGHGITQFQIGWTNVTLQRALDEGMSDIWATIFEYRFRPDLQTWRIGEQITKTALYERNLQNTQDASARTKMVDTYGTGAFDIAGYYSKSGVLSHWFYVLVNGEIGTNDLGNPYSVTGIGFNKAEALTVEAVFNNYLDGTTNYPEVRTAMINAARSLYCGYAPEVQAVVNAWYAVGVGPEVMTGTKLVCNGSQFVVNNIPTGATVTWSSNNPGLSINAVTGAATRQNNFNGQVVVTATVQAACGSAPVTKTVWVGKPSSPGYPIVVGGSFNDMCVNSQVQVMLNPVSSATSYSWVSNDPAGLGVDDLDGTAATITGLAPSVTAPSGYWTVTFSADNACGGTSSIYGVVINSCTSDEPLVRVGNGATESDSVRTIDEEEVYGAPFPNPATESLTVEVEEVSSIILSDANGQKLYTGIAKGKTRVSVAHLLDGVYILSITNTKGLVSYKVLVQH